MLKYVLPTLTALFVGFLAGYFLRDLLMSELTNHSTEFRGHHLSEVDNTDDNTAALDTTIIQPAGGFSNGTGVTDKKAMRLSDWTFDDIADQFTVFDQLIVAYRVAADSDEIELKAHIKRCLGSNDPFYNPHLLSIFFEKYTALDPLAALAFVSSEPRLDAQSLVGHILTSWVRADPVAAVDYFVGLNNQILVRAIGPRLLSDPIVSQSGLSKKIEQKLGPGSDLLVEQARARTALPSDLFEAAMLQTGNRRTVQLQQALGQWASRDPEAALTRIRQMQNPAERQRLTRTAVMIFSQVDPENALAYVRNALTEDTRLEGMVLNAMAAADPESSTERIEEFSRRTGDNSAIINLLSNWVAKDPAKAITYAETLSDNLKIDAFARIARSFVNNYPTQGVDWLLALGSEHKQTKKSVLRSLARIDSQLAEDTVRRLDDSDLRSTLINSLASFKSETSPAAALAWVEQFKEANAYQQARSSILRNWVRTDPQGAIEELEGDLDKDNMAPVVTQLASSWYRRNPVDAVEWLESLPVGAGQQRALSAIVGLVAAKDPESAIALADQITNQQRRRDAKRSIGYAWYAREPAQLDSIIRRLKLTEQDANQLRLARRGNL